MFRVIRKLFFRCPLRGGVGQTDAERGAEAHARGSFISSVAGEMVRSDEARLTEWWVGDPMAFPYWGGEKIRVVYDFRPSDDPAFFADADAALANFLRLTRHVRAQATPFLEENCREILDLIGTGEEAAELEKIWIGEDVWSSVALPTEVRLQRRNRRDGDVYVALSMRCAWGEQNLLLVYRQGRTLTRVSHEDGWLTTADALDTPDSEDTMLAAFDAKG